MCIATNHGMSTGNSLLASSLIVPRGARAVIVLPWSGRREPRLRRLAATLHARRLATCVIDLLADRETPVDAVAAELIELTDQICARPASSRLPIGYLAAELSAATLIAAAARPLSIRAVVSWGGRPDLAIAALPRVIAATLLLVPENDACALARNRCAIAALLGPAWIEVVPETAALRPDDVARRAIDWFVDHVVDEHGYRHAS